MSKKTKILVIYTGGGFGGTFTGIPAKDLTAEDVEAAGGLDKVISTGLYKLVEDKKAKPAAAKEKDKESKT